MTPRPVYPPAPRTDVVETLHGVRVADPFRTLEDAADPATIAWVEAENALTRSMLDGRLRDRLVARLTGLHRYPRASVPAVRGRRLFFAANDGTRNQPILFMQEDHDTTITAETAETSNSASSASSAFTVIVDPNALAADGTTAVTAFQPDDTGDRVVYGLSSGGSDWQDLFIHDVTTGRDLPDRLRWVKFASIAWTADGFFYTRFPEPGRVAPEHAQYFCQVWFHRVGDAQEADRLIYDRPDAPEVVFDVNVTADGRHLVITSQRGASDNAEVHVIDIADCRWLIADSNSPINQQSAISNLQSLFRPLVTGFTDGWHFIDGRDGHLYFHTDAGAPLGRIVRFDLDDPGVEPRTLVAESAHKLELAAISGGRLVVSWLKHASSALQRFDLEGCAGGDIGLPGLGTLVGIGARWHDDRCAVTFTSFTMPPTIFECDVSARRLVAMDATVALPIDPADYITEQVWYASRDGTRVSMFLVKRRDGPLAGEDANAVGDAVLLTGYGGFNISLTPTFDPSDFLWLDAGGTIAVANLRGGGEYGEGWHQAGMRDRKQNVFDDFIAATEALVATGRAAPGRIAIEGGSNGGLLVGAAMVQRPDLFGAVICRVPVADMLRYHLFTVGRFWIPEYGSADDPQQFATLLRYSPYHNVRDDVRYPPALVMTADTDDRVAPGMAKKFAARLQEAQHGDAPVLLRVETRAGHGAGKPIAKSIDEHADIYAFLFAYLTRTSVSAQQRR